MPDVTACGRDLKIGDVIFGRSKVRPEVGVFKATYDGRSFVEPAKGLLVSTRLCRFSRAFFFRPRSGGR